MRRRLHIVVVSLLGAWVLGMASGCDEAGVADIVWGSAQLAYGIVDVAT